MFTQTDYWWQNTSVTLPLFHTVLDNNKDNVQFFDHIIKQEEIATTFPAISNKILGKEVPLNKVNTFNDRHQQAKTKIEMLLKLQGIVEYLQQTGVELPKEEEAETEVVTPETETSDK